MYHQIGSINSEVNRERKFSQLLFYDTHFEELERRKDLLQNQMNVSLSE